MTWCFKGTNSYIFCKICLCRAYSKPRECNSSEHAAYYLEKLESSRVSNRSNRLETLIHYGGACLCCGFSDLEAIVQGRRFLQLDHIGGNGTVHRKELKSNNVYNWARSNSYPNTLRVLCAGCNVSIEPNEERCLLHRGSAR